MRTRIVFSSRRRHTRFDCDWSSDVCSSDLADWCGPCKIMAPILDDFARQRQGDVLVLKLDTDRNPATALRFNIRAIPTLIVFRDGREVARRAGGIARPELDALVGPTRPTGPS